MSKLREALEKIRDSKPKSYGGEDLWRWRETVLARARQALAAPSDMDKLVEWLEAEEEAIIEPRVSPHTQEEWRVFRRGYVDALETCSAYIRTIREGDDAE